MMWQSSVLAIVLLPTFGALGVVRADELIDWRSIRVLKTAAEAAGCEFRGMAQDDDMEDILKKARKISGDTVVMTQTMRGKDFVVEVYRCTRKGSAK